LATDNSTTFDLNYTKRILKSNTDQEICSTDLFDKFFKVSRLEGVGVLHIQMVKIGIVHPRSTWYTETAVVIN